MKNPQRELEEELNLVAEYAGIFGHLSISVETTENPKESLVKLGSQEFLVETSWCMGNIKRLPDKATRKQFVYALGVSHPEIRGLSERELDPEKE